MQDTHFWHCGMQVHYWKLNEIQIHHPYCYGLNQLHQSRSRSNHNLIECKYIRKSHFLFQRFWRLQCYSNHHRFLAIFVVTMSDFFLKTISPKSSKIFKVPVVAILNHPLLAPSKKLFSDIINHLPRGALYARYSFFTLRYAGALLKIEWNSNLPLFLL